MIRYIYTFFVGLFLAIFTGTAIAVFYTEPAAPVSPTFYGKEPTTTERQQQQVFDVKQRAYEKQLQHYNRNASMIILLCAVVILTISLTLAEKLGILADGILLGGIFILFYGIGRGMASDNNKYKLLVAAIGLVVTLVLGYIKFKPQRRLS